VTHAKHGAVSLESPIRSLWGGCATTTGQDVRRQPDRRLPKFRLAKNNRPIGLNQNIKRKRSEIKWIGRLFCA